MLKYGRKIGGIKVNTAFGVGRGRWRQRSYVVENMKCPKTRIVVTFTAYTVKGTRITIAVVNVDLNTLSGTKPWIVTPRKYVDHPRHFHMVPPPLASLKLTSFFWLIRWPLNDIIFIWKTNGWVTSLYIAFSSHFPQGSWMNGDVKTGKEKEFGLPCWFPFLHTHFLLFSQWSPRVKKNWFKPFAPKSTKFKTKEKKSWISLCKIVKNKQHHMKVLLNSFHLNGHSLDFHPQTQKLQPHSLTQGLTLGVKGLNTWDFTVQIVVIEHC